MAKDKALGIEDGVWQIEPRAWRGMLAGCRVTLGEHRDDRVSNFSGPREVGQYSREGALKRISRKPSGLPEAGSLRGDEMAVCR